MILKIVEWPAKVLETSAEKILVFDDKLKQLVKDMHETMSSSNGIGLAANQVGELKRIVVIKIAWIEEDPEETAPQEKKEKKAWWHDKAFTFINPEIIKGEGKTKYQEGCLSFPGIFEFIERKDLITVAAQDETGKKFEVEATGLFSVCLQHEIDHINGIVFLKRMSRLKAALVRNKLSKTVKFDSVED